MADARTRELTRLAVELTADHEIARRRREAARETTTARVDVAAMNLANVIKAWARAVHGNATDWLRAIAEEEGLNPESLKQALHGRFEGALFETIVRRFHDEAGVDLAAVAASVEEATAPPLAAAA